MEAVGDAALTRDAEDVTGFREDILSVIREGDVRKRLIEKGQRRVKRFRWEKTALETLRVYRDLCPGARDYEAVREKLAG